MQCMGLPEGNDCSGTLGFACLTLGTSQEKNRSVPLVHLIEILIRNFAEKMPFTRYLLFEMGFVETGIDTWLGIRNL